AYFEISKTWFKLNELGFCRAWICEVNKPNNKMPSLLRSLFEAFGSELVKIVVLAVFCETFMRIVEVICVGEMLQYFQTGKTMTFKDGVSWGVGLIAANLLRFIAFGQFRIRSLQLTSQIRAGCSSLIYRK
ncbi:hypothetical protein HHI36_006609, partial [Cryptolaemus montrouzieri]